MMVRPGFRLEAGRKGSLAYQNRKACQAGLSEIAPSSLSEQMHHWLIPVIRLGGKITMLQQTIQSVPLFQILTRFYPPRRDNVRALPVVA
jgi:hypothetical protein